MEIQARSIVLEVQDLQDPRVLGVDAGQGDRTVIWSLPDDPTSWDPSDLSAFEITAEDWADFVQFWSRRQG